MRVGWKLAVVGLGAALAVGALVAAVNMTGAQTQTPNAGTPGATGTASGSVTPPVTLTPGPTPFNGDVLPFFIQQFAQNLGVPIDKVEQAFRDAALATIDQQVAEGTISPDQGSQIKQQLEGGQLPIASLLQDPFSSSGIIPGQGVIDSSAQAIGIDSSALVAQLRAGKTIEQVADDHNVSLDKVETQVVNDAKTRLDQYVKTGAITQTQANALLQDLQSRLDTMLKRQFAPISTVTPGTSTPGTGVTPQPSGTATPST